MTEMVEFFKLSYYSYRGGKKLHQIGSATCIYRTVFELKNILASIVLGMYKFDVEHDSSSERSQIKIRRTDVVSTLVKY